MQPLAFLLVSLSLACVLSVPLSPSKVIHAIDSGSLTSSKSAVGFLYTKDEGFSQSRVADYSNNQDVAHVRIKYTFDPSIYMTERHHDDSFSYDISIPKEGKYTLILKFAEMYFREPNKRVFNIKFGERTVIQGLDVVARVGPFAACDEYIEFEFKEDQILFENEVCPKAYKTKNQKLSVTLEKTDKDLPIISGLILYQGGLDETDFYELPDFRNQWQQKIDEQLRAEEEEQRNRFNQKKKLMESLGEGVFEFEESNESRMTSIIRILLSQEGAIIMGTLLSCALLLMIFGKEPEKSKAH